MTRPIALILAILRLVYFRQGLLDQGAVFKGA